MTAVTSSAVRAHLVRALEAELVGALRGARGVGAGAVAHDLTGFLVPREDSGVDLTPTEQENLRALLRVLHVRLGTWPSVRRTLPLTHDTLAGSWPTAAR
jgi:hypothetical protein